MSDYIKREDLLNALNAQRIVYNAAVNETIIKLPSADVVEVVRCKDCKYWQDQEEGIVEVPICTRSELISIRGKDDYCSYGERAEE